MHTRMMSILLLGACGDNAAIEPDAAVDALEPDAAMVCGAPTKLCGTTCKAVTEDEQNCGDCGVVCKGGEACTGTCTCPPSFIPTAVDPSQFDQFRMPGGGVTIAIAPIFGAGGVNPLLIGYMTPPLATDIDLATAVQLPFVAAGYHLDLGTMVPDAGYRAISGTLRFTRACATEVEGTLTNAMFQGVNGGLTAPVTDPLGCTFTVPTVAFHVMTAACP